MKIIGIVLGVLLALLLLLLGILLFVPIRYRIYASKYDTIQAKAKVSYLCKIVSFRFRYYSEEETYSYCLRIFGYPVIDSNRPPKVKKEKKVKVKKVKPARSQTSKTKVRKIETVEIEKKQDIQIKDHYEEEHKVEDNEIQDNKIVYKEVEVDKNDIINPLQKEHTNIVRNEKVVEEKVDEEERESFLHRITKPFRATIQRIKEVIRKVREVIRSARNIFSNVKAKIHLVKDFLEVEDNRKGLGRVYAGIKKILKHILPYKVKGFVRFGLDDPCNTGYLLGVLSLVYPIYANKIQIIPDFQEEVLEGQVDAKGRIRAFTLLIIGIKLILDDNFKKLLKNVKELKEEF
ncbi:DUF2953 domain-containing protein [Anaerosporobacter sp.]